MAGPDGRADPTDRSPLPRWFYDRPTREVARDLLGTYLVHAPEGAHPPRVVRLVETEAYVAGDPANHAYRGPTPRNRTMFRGPGHLYVYRIHQVVCANVTTRPGEAVLLRAGEPVQGIGSSPQGPGRLCRAMGILHVHDGMDLVDGRITLRPRIGAPPPIQSTPRVGIRRAARRPLRFLVPGSPWVSRRPRPRRSSPLPPQPGSRS